MQINWKVLAILAVIGVGVFATYKFAAGKAADALGVGNIKVSLYNWVVSGVMTVLFILAAKALTAKFPIPGVTEAVHAV